MQMSRGWGFVIAFSLCAAGAGLALHFVFLDGLLNTVLGAIIADTDYAPDYSEARFREVQVGMSEKDVLNRLGEPLEYVWQYEDRPADQAVPHFVLLGPNGRVTRTFAPQRADVREGMDASDVLRALGEPNWRNWHYTRARDWEHYFVRSIRFQHDRVVEIFHGLYID